MSPRKRVPFKPQVVAYIMFEADRTCCICRIHGCPVQIHHIDEDPSNNDPANLVVLCLECHNETQIGGGFGRRLDALQVRRYWEDWLGRVRSRRDLAYPLGIKGVVVGEGDTYEEALADVKSAIPFHVETFGEEALDAEPPILEVFVAKAGVEV